MTIRIKNWNQFQHFKDRRPPWIKLHRDILEQRDIMMISDRSFRVLICIWLLASEDKDMEGKLPDIPDIAFRLRMSEKEISQALQELSAHLLNDDVNMISERYQDDVPETETETETETEKKIKVKKSGLEKPHHVSIQTWNDWHTLRKAKKAPVTQTALDRIETEAIKAGISLDDALQESVARGWVGFKAEWLNKNNQTQNNGYHGKSTYNKPSKSEQIEAGLAEFAKEFDGRSIEDIIASF